MTSFSDYMGKIDKEDVSVRMREAFRDYAMSVIVSRALPDVRDGLKPVHRRILHAMNELSMHADKPHKKSARIVGEVIGKYHPHGDSSVYDAMVRLAQPFNVREILIDGHGNFGSMDGDSPAAMRYTEARLSKLAMEMLRDIKKNTVDFEDNFDGEEREPKILPSRFPNILVNGASGIAVGMATSIPSHNLREVCMALIALIDNESMTIDDIMTYIKGPDYPTGGLIMGQKRIKHAYETGKTGKGNSVKLRAKVDIIEKGDKRYLHVTELPYQTNKEKLIEKLESIQLAFNRADIEKKKPNPKPIDDEGYDFAKTIEDKTERIEIEKNHVSIMIELKDYVIPETVLNYLYKNTELEKSISINLLALVPSEDGKGTAPKILSIKEILMHYIKHQLEVIERKYKWELDDLLMKSHKLAGLIKALDKMDETVETIKSASSKPIAIDSLKTLLDVDDVQAEDILKRRLQTLATFEQDSLREEYQEYLTKITYCELVLAEESERRKIIQNDLQFISDKYGNDRLTPIYDEIEDIDNASTIPNHEVVMTITKNGFIKRTKDSVYRVQRRKGQGVNGMGMWEGDYIHHLCFGHNHDKVLFFTSHGKVYETVMYKIMEASATSKGYNMKAMFNFDKDEEIQAVLNIQDFSEEQFLLFATENGIVKKSKLSEYANIHSNGIKAIRLDIDEKTKEISDRLIGVSLTSGDSNVTLVTQNGQSITFNETDVASIGRTGRGVKGITLSEGDSVISLDVHKGEADLLVVTDYGFGKRTPLSEFRVQTRGGKGVAAIRLSEKNGTKVIGVESVLEADFLFLITKIEGKLMKMAVKEISKFQRNTQGSKIINVKEGDSLSSIARVADFEDDDVESDTSE